MNRQMTIEDVVMKLVGNITPVGDSVLDAERFQNLKVLCATVDELVKRIDYVATYNKERQEWSMKVAGLHADKFLSDTLGINQ
jgi:hypothetical protein